MADFDELKDATQALSRALVNLSEAGPPRTSSGAQCASTIVGVPLEGPRNPLELYLATLSPPSTRNARSAFNQIVKILRGAQGDPFAYPWWELDYSATVRLRERLLKRYKPTTVVRMLTNVRGVLRACWRLGLMTADDFASASDWPRVPATALPAGRCLPAKEIAALFAACAADPAPHGRRDAATIAVMVGTGVRVGEAVKLRLADLDVDTRVLRVRHGKGNRQRVAYLADGAEVPIAHWLQLRGTAPGPLLCPIPKGKGVVLRVMTTRAVQSLLKKRCREASIEPIGPHSLRRTFCTTLLERGVDVFVVSRLMGHASVEMTARYDRRDERAQVSAVQRLALPFTPADAP